MKTNFIHSGSSVVCRFSRLLALGFAFVAAAMALSKQYACAQTAVPGPREVPESQSPNPPA